MDKKKINELVLLYFQHNPQNNKGIGYRVKANDIITAYATKHNMSYEDIKHCIESQPMTQKYIWDQFYEYHFKKNNMKKEENSAYKNSIGDSTNIEDWL